MLSTNASSLPFTPDEAWALIEARNSGADGRLFYGVRSTGIFCRPSCPSRRPARSRVELFTSAAEALYAGYRPCKRCSPTETAPKANMVQLLCGYLDQNRDRPVKLAELARVAVCSPFTVQRIFQRVLGVSPAQYQSHQHSEAFRQNLKTSNVRITDAIYAAGYSSPSRAYSGHKLGMKPGNYRKGGRGETLGYATGSSPLGCVFIAASDKGLCFVGIEDTEEAAVRTLRGDYPDADLRPDPALAPMLAQVLSQLTEHPAALDLPLDLRGTAFQMRVWQALRKIPRGETRTYGQLAQSIGHPKGARAVGRACATNPASIVVPCHRAVGSSGSLTGYRWGLERKRRLLALEASPKP